MSECIKLPLNFHRDMNMTHNRNEIKYLCLGNKKKSSFCLHDNQFMIMCAKNIHGIVNILTYLLYLSISDF